MSYKMKSAYQSRAVAGAYFDKRFSHPRGRRENEATEVALEQALNSIRGAKIILDMPCGSGRFTYFFIERGYFYVGADVSMEMMEVLAREQRSLAVAPVLVRCDAEALPFKDSVFDCVVCVRFLNTHRLSKIVREAVLREMRRVSRRWLILQCRELRFQGPFVRLKVFLRKLFGRETAKYEFEKELVETGWQAKERVGIRTINRYVGVYHKI